MATKKKKPPRELYAGTCVDSMNRPNLLVPLTSSDTLPRMFFPLLNIQLEAYDGDRGHEQGLFFDPMHGSGWFEWVDRAPTWMDPHKFVEIALTNPRLRGCLEYCFKHNTERPAERDMPEMLDEAMDEYMAYVLDMFERAKPYLIAWMVRNHCYEATTPVKKSRRPKRKAVE